MTYIKIKKNPAHLLSRYRKIADTQGFIFESDMKLKLQLPSFSPLLSRNALFELALFFLNSRLRIEQVIQLCRDEGDEQDRGGTEQEVPDMEVM